MLESLIMRDVNQMYEILFSPITVAEIKMLDDMSQPRMCVDIHTRVLMGKKMDKRSQETNLAIHIKF